MMLAWHWPWAALAGVLATLAIIVLIVVFARRNAADDTPVFSMDDDLNTEHASRLFRQWRALGRLAISVLVLALALAIVLVARPSQVDAGDERASSRDIVLCLDVSGSTLPYDREVIDTYLELVKHFEGTYRFEYLQLDLTHGVPADRRLRTGHQTVDLRQQGAERRRVAG